MNPGRFLAAVRRPVLERTAHVKLFTCAHATKIPCLLHEASANLRQAEAVLTKHRLGPGSRHDMELVMLAKVLRMRTLC